VSLLAGGVACPPFSIAGKQLGADDERDLFPQALRLIEECQPAAVMLENVPGLSTRRFDGYRDQVLARLAALGYQSDWQVLNACDFGVPQLRPRFILVACGPGRSGTSLAGPGRPAADRGRPRLRDLMGADGWPARRPGPSGPTASGPRWSAGRASTAARTWARPAAREAWLRLSVDGKGLADAPPGPAHPVDHLPRLTLPMAAAIQGFPADWRFSGRKTAGYRQIGNAFPPPVARAVGGSIRMALAVAAAERAAAELAAAGLAARSGGCERCNPARAASPLSGNSWDPTASSWRSSRRRPRRCPRSARTRRWMRCRRARAL
jgi:DNA (cytosine-5)-methyltransferase 1